MTTTNDVQGVSAGGEAEAHLLQSGGSPGGVEEGPGVPGQVPPGRGLHQDHPPPRHDRGHHPQGHHQLIHQRFQSHAAQRKPSE